MKRLTTIILLCVLGLSFNSLGMNTPPDTTMNIWDKAGAGIAISEGKNLFHSGNTRGALIKFREALAKYNNSSNANYWIAECQYRLNSYGIALKYINIAIELNPDLNKDIYVLRGQSYHRMGKLDSAIIAFEKAKEINSKSNIKFYKIDEKIASAKFAKVALKSPLDLSFNLLPEPVNSKFADYGPVLTNNGKTLYFTSRRNNTTGGTVNPGDNIFFEDIYMSEWNDTRKAWVSATNKNIRINTAGHESVSDISADGLKMLLTINDDSENIPKKERKYKSKSSDICIAMRTDQDGWNKPKLLSKSIQTGGYDGSATMTADGNTVYFSSQTKESVGPNLYMITSDDGKRWSDPIKLPDHINTSETETTPIVSPDGMYLFFSSNGLTGMGGHDVFVTKNLGNDEWSLPVNMGAPINSVNDDTHFRYYKDLNKAFMSKMTLQGNKASRDIVEVDMSKFEFPEFKKFEKVEKEDKKEKKEKKK